MSGACKFAVPLPPWMGFPRRQVDGKKSKKHFERKKTTMKRFLSITLVVCMLLASLTFMTFAETVPANAKFRTGEEGSYVYHEDLISALHALHGTGGVVTQIADYTHGAVRVDGKNNKANDSDKLSKIAILPWNSPQFLT